MKVIRLQPKGTFRTEMSSDSIFGVICWGIHVLYGQEVLEDILGQFSEGSPPFLISAAFPYVEENGNIIYFFPRPILPPITGKLSGDYLDKFKKFKKIKWLSYEQFRKFQSGEWDENLFFLEDNWEDSPTPQMKTDIQMHNSINRLTGTTGEGNLFYTPVYRIYNGGLYFLIKELKEGFTDYIIAAFRLFSHLGIGGDASVGKGTFEPEIDNFPYDLSISNGNSFIVMSYYYPRATETRYFSEKPNLTWYRLVHRKGKMGGILYPTGNTWKRSIHIFDVGSVFPKIPDASVIGDFPVVKAATEFQPFEVFFNGYPLTLEFKLQENS